MAIKLLRERRSISRKKCLDVTAESPCSFGYEEWDMAQARQGLAQQNNVVVTKTMMMRLQISVASVAEESYDNCASSGCLPEFGCDHDRRDLKQSKTAFCGFPCALPFQRCADVRSRRAQSVLPTLRLRSVRLRKN